jgi:hypothetical protein
MDSQKPSEPRIRWLKKIGVRLHSYIILGVTVHKVWEPVNKLYKQML